MAQENKQVGRGWVRRTLLQIQIGGILGLVAWSLTGASLITWWYKPPVDQPTSCTPMVASALNDFTQYQAIAAAVGAALVMVFGSFTSKRKNPTRQDGVSGL